MKSAKNIQNEAEAKKEEVEAKKMVVDYLMTQFDLKNDGKGNYNTNKFSFSDVLNFIRAQNGEPLSDEEESKIIMSCQDLLQKRAPANWMKPIELNVQQDRFNNFVDFLTKQTIEHKVGGLAQQKKVTNQLIKILKDQLKLNVDEKQAQQLYNFIEKFDRDLPLLSTSLDNLEARLAQDTIEDAKDDYNNLFFHIMATTAKVNRKEIETANESLVAEMKSRLATSKDPSKEPGYHLPYPESIDDLTRPLLDYIFTSIKPIPNEAWLNYHKNKEEYSQYNTTRLLTETMFNLVGIVTANGFQVSQGQEIQLRTMLHSLPEEALMNFKTQLRHSLNYSGNGNAYEGVDLSNVMKLTANSNAIKDIFKLATQTKAPAPVVKSQPKVSDDLEVKKSAIEYYLMKHFELKIDDKGNYITNKFVPGDVLNILQPQNGDTLSSDEESEIIDHCKKQLKATVFTNWLKATKLNITKEQFDIFVNLLSKHTLSPDVIADYKADVKADATARKEATPPTYLVESMLSGLGMKKMPTSVVMDDKDVSKEIKKFKK